MSALAPEFSREIDLRSLPSERVTLTSTREERAALARRFGIIALESLSATVALQPDGPATTAIGRLRARLVQSCAVSGEDLAVAIDEPVALRFVPAVSANQEEEELELAPEGPDEIPYEGTIIDLGEALAQTLALAVDPYAIGPEAERARAEAGLSTPEQSGPFAALAALRNGSA